MFQTEHCAALRARANYHEFISLAQQSGRSCNRYMNWTALAANHVAACKLRIGIRQARRRKIFPYWLRHRVEALDTIASEQVPEPVYQQRRKSSASCRLSVLTVLEVYSPALSSIAWSQHFSLAMRRFTGSQHGRRYNATDPCNITADVSSVVVNMQEIVAIEEDEEYGV